MNHLPLITFQNLLSLVRLQNYHLLLATWQDQLSFVRDVYLFSQITKFELRSIISFYFIKLSCILRLFHFKIILIQIAEQTLFILFDNIYLQARNMTSILRIAV